MSNITNATTIRSSTKSALILGATGGSGRAISMSLLRRGWALRAMHRKGAEQAHELPEAEWVQGDAMSPSDVRRAAQGVQLIVHAVNPPGYRKWGELVLPMIDNTIGAACEVGARIVLPGTVYNFGPDAFPQLSEDAPQRAPTEKGRIRVEMERRLEAATHHGALVLILRAGDFFGPGATGNSWFSQGVVAPGKPLTQVNYPGEPDAGHAWAYLPDFAEAVARLVEREDDLPPFARFHFGGHYFARGIEIAERVRALTDGRVKKIGAMPWLVLKLLAPFNETMREVLKMRYLWRASVELDNARLVAFLGEEPHTPIDIALVETLKGLGCLTEDVKPDAAELAEAM